MSLLDDGSGSAVAVVTGATGGLGKEITRGLLREGMTVILGVRDLQKAEAVKTQLEREPGGGHIELATLDLASLASVRSFAGEVANRQSSIGLLVNNAGAWFNERQLSPDGHEMTLATNALGPYALTEALLPLLLSGKPSRIINIVSAATGSYDVEDLDWERRDYDGFRAYTQSKQALRFMTWILARQLEGREVVVNAVSPGFVKTGFLDDTTGLVATLLRLISPFATSPAKAADTPLWVALAPEWSTRTGRYVEARKEKDGGSKKPAELDKLHRLLRSMIS